MRRSSKSWSEPSVVARICSVVLLMICATLSMQGQTISGRISGTVKDKAGAVIPNASVTVTNTATNLVLNKKNIYNYDNLERIADNRGIDIVYVVTPPALHPEFALRLAKAGKHIISEKPMATSVADCDRMIAACKAAKVKLAIGYRLHYDLYHKEMMRLAREQDFGPFMKMTGDRWS